MISHKFENPEKIIQRVSDLFVIGGTSNRVEITNLEPQEGFVESFRVWVMFHNMDHENKSEVIDYFCYRVDINPQKSEVISAKILC